MSIKRSISITAAAATLAATGVAGAAEAPVVSKQHSLFGTATVTVPGTGVQQGEWMGSKAHLVFRDVTLEGDQQARVLLRAPAGKTLRGLAIAEGGDIGFRVEKPRRYAGRKQVTVRVQLAPHAGDGESTGRIYALVK